MSDVPYSKRLEEALQQKGFRDVTKEEKLRQLDDFLRAFAGSSLGDSKVGLRELQRLRGTDYDE